MDMRLHRVTHNTCFGVTVGAMIGAMTTGVVPRAMAVCAVRKAQAPFLATRIVTDMDMADRRIVG